MAGMRRFHARRHFEGDDRRSADAGRRRPAVALRAGGIRQRHGDALAKQPSRKCRLLRTSRRRPTERAARGLLESHARPGRQPLVAGLPA
jgi:hypothetical protein